MLFVVNNKIIFIINYKCLFSTFNNDKLTFIKKERKIENIDLLPIKNFYIIVKNPIKRLISFYKDKILNQVKTLNKLSQNCIQQLLNFYDEKFIKSKKFNFSCLVDAIKKGYRNDHFNPQHILYDDVKKFDTNINIEIMKVEDNKFNNNLKNILNIPMNKLINNTNHIIFEEELKEDDIIFLKKFYKRDYELFNY
jgi:hypothetical protein